MSGSCKVPMGLVLKLKHFIVVIHSTLEITYNNHLCICVTLCIVLYC